MILRALYDYYLKKSQMGGIAPVGFAPKEIDFLILLDKSGNYIDVESMQTIKNKKLRGKEFWVPAIGKQVERHSNAGNDANLLWDKAEFVLGIGNKKKVKFNSFLDTIRQYYPSPPNDVKTVVDFLVNENNQSDRFKSLLKHPEYGEQISSGKPTLSFRIDNSEPIFSQEHVKTALSNNEVESEVNGTCLITGETNIPIELTHTPTKGVLGAQTSGANLVAFNQQSFISYNKKKSACAPISKKVAAGYTKALQYLLDSSTNKSKISDSTIVYWSEKASESVNLEEGLAWVISLKKATKDDPDIGVQHVKTLYNAVRTGRISIDKDKRFYVLGLSPNSARISVRFWIVGTIEEIGKSIIKHIKDLEIEKRDYEREFILLDEILSSVSTETKDFKKPNIVFYKGKAFEVQPNLAGEVINSVLKGNPYPKTLMQSCIRRIRAEAAKKDQNGKLIPSVTRTRAAILKAYLNRNKRINNHKYKEIKMALDLQNDEVGYVLGRLFALLEKIQEEAAKPNRLNSTIRERYYSSLSSSPTVVLPLLMRLKNHHLAKISGGLKNWYENKLAEVTDLINAKNIPSHLTLEQQALFAIGYYHQRIHKDEKTK